MKKQILFALSTVVGMNIALARPTVKIWGSNDPLPLLTQVRQCLAYLDVRENIHLAIYLSPHMPEKLQGRSFCLNSPEPNAYQVIRVWIDTRLNKKQQRLVLAHEMIHVKQYAKGELIMTSNQQVMWKGRNYRYQWGAEPHRAPWESEAHRMDNRLAKLCKEQPETPLFASDTKR